MALGTLTIFFYYSSQPRKWLSNKPRDTNYGISLRSFHTPTSLQNVEGRLISMPSSADAVVLWRSVDLSLLRATSLNGHDVTSSPKIRLQSCQKPKPAPVERTLVDSRA